MDALRITRAARPFAESSAIRHRDFGRRLGVGRRETKAVDKDGETEIGRLAELAVQEREKPRAIQHDGKNLATLKLTVTEQTEANGEHGAPDQIGEPKYRATFQYDAPPLALRQKKDGATGKKLRATISADAEPVTRNGRPAQKQH